MSDFLYAIDNILTQEEYNKYIKLFDNSSNVEKINDKHKKYGCWDSEYGFNTKKWYLVQIDIKTGERTRPTKKRVVKKKVAKKKKNKV